jgi:tetratricopeptide (TPR) repeat protein
MRSAEIISRVLALAAAMALGGCASLNEPLKSITDTVTAPFKKDEAKDEAKAAAAAPVSSSASAVAAAPKPLFDAPVPPAAQRAFDEAVRQLAAGRTQDAERGFKALVQSNPELGGPHANLGLIHRQAGRLPEAVAELELAVKASPQQAVYLNQLGVTYRMAGQFAKAREAYQRAIALDAGYAAPELNLAILHDMYLRENALALQHYERYLVLAANKDATVAKWVADLKNRKTDKTTMLSKKEVP